MTSIFKKLFYDNKWECAYHIKNDNNILYGGDYKVVTIPRGYWAADPFLVDYNGHVHMFFEYMDQKKHKAMIAQKEIFPVEEDQVHVVYEFPYHTSYPCIFKFNQKYFMIPETRANNSIELLECIEWPNKWIHRGTLMEDVDSADNTVIIDENNARLLVYKFLEDGKRELLLGRIDFDRNKICDLQTLKIYNNKNGRPAGNVFSINKDSFIRVVQPDFNYYGEKIVFYSCSLRNWQFDEIKYDEKTIESIQIMNKHRYIGVHTYNCVGNIECVDLLTKERLNLFKPLKLFFQYLNVFGFGRYEQKRKIINSDFH